MSAIYDRLTRQLAARGVASPRRMAKGLLNRYGLMRKGSQTLTTKGKKQNSLSPGQRAKKRAAKASGHPPSAFVYNAKTNRATLRRSAG